MNSQIESESGTDCTTETTKNGNSSRRLRVYRLPYQALVGLLSPQPVPSDSETATVHIPTQLALPDDAEVLNVWENPGAMALDLLIRSDEFPEVPIGEIAPPCTVEIPMREVVAVDPETYQQMTVRSPAYDLSEADLDILKFKAYLWDQFAVRLSPSRLSPRRHSPAFRWVFRWDSILWLYRLCRFTYEVGERGQKGWHAVQWTLGLVPTFYKFRREDDSWILRILGLRIHRKVSYGGRPD